MLGLDEKEDKQETIDEAAYDPEDVITVKDFLEIIARRVSKYDTVFFKSGKTMLELIDIHAKGGVTVLDFMKSKPGANVSNLDIYTVEDLINCIKKIPFDVNNKVMFRDMDSKTELSFFDLYSKRGVATFEFAVGKTYELDEDEECCCRAKDLKWHAVKDVCPDCASKMSDDWRCGPAAKKFCDLLYPSRKYKPGTLIMRNKAVKAGAESGEKIIAVPSYFYAI